MAFYPGGLASSHDEFLNTIINSFKYRMIQTWVSLFLSEFHSPDYKQLKYMLPFQNQTWKKLQAVQAALADILSEIMLFLGHFESNIIYF